ncbi:phage N-6-adenine-methyltransferase [Escherichia coli]|nr:phage N-6-adenine-methyltransferase [Escherichia coli]EFB5434016.1 phage N-6-adenine-methyltransferase [Escherichia coli O157]EES5245024.1 phage N-6-adenine-methyltransferase [Escherichia coli]EEU3398433.1 phage N-6-adenine-methyltransferase [Escherichia coli]EEX0838802.1 phage N-6-adenine-methyltransferase [Escherichia coli]
MIMSLLNDVQKFIEAHPGCTSGDIADAFAGYSRQRVLQSASKLRQSGRVAHRCEGDTRRHFPRLTERAQEPEPQPVRETRPVRNFYVGTNDPRVILCLTRQAEELESRGLYRRAATVWMAAFRESHSQPERNNFLARRERCLRKSSKRAASGEEWYLSGNFVGGLMSNKYCQALVELRNKPAHELKEVGDQWRTPDNIFWGINTLFGPFVLDLFTDGDNAKCAAYYTAEDNALAHDWSERLAELKGAAFGNPPYSRASQHEGQYITGMRYIMKHASAMRDKGGRYVFLIKAATSEVWWPEDADHIAFIRGRIGFELPAWFIPKDEKQVPTGAFFAGAIAVFDKTWKGPAISYIGRDELEACGEAFLAQVRQQAEKLVREMAA